MTAYIIRRLAWAVVLLFVISAVTFAPGVAAAYVAGYLGPAPGGVGMRDGALVILLSGNGMPIGPALALAGASRLMFTINELGAAAPFFFTRETPRDHT